jgi:hypothetical protein
MSAASATFGGISLPSRARGLRAADSPRLATDIALFAALAFIGLAQWSRLVVNAPTIKLVFALGVICAGARLLVAVRPGPNRGALWTLAAVGIAIATFCFALIVAGLPARLLVPSHWGEFASNIGDGLRGIEDSTVPYDGANEWVGLDFMLAGPALVAIAAAIAFWPAADRSHRRVFALMLLVATFTVPVALYPPSAQLFWGFALLLLAVTWIWIERLHGSRRILALVVALGAGVLALPIAARAGDEPIFDYRSWDLFGASASVSFQWDHSYGPLDWPRDGATMFTVKTDRPLYWKASVLDRFDGVGWQRAASADPTSVAERAARGQTPVGALTDVHPGWVQDASFTIEGLQTSLLMSAGAPLAVEGAGDISAAVDGTIVHRGGPLEGSSDYKIVTYDPNPTVDQMQAAPAHYPFEKFRGTTLIGVPPTELAPPETLPMPLWGKRDPFLDKRLLTSPNADTYRLARAWTADATTPYEAVIAIENNLRQDYSYSPDVPDHRYPLHSFLFDDQAGYCQQFSGSMALMLRMIGIPSRVVTGFAPGSPNSENGSYVVHDFDAHSWVEVFFRGIGWVTFDPTPASAPAESQRFGGEAIERRGGALLSDSPGGGTEGGHGIEAGGGAAGTTGTSDSGVPTGLIVLALLGATMAATVVIYRRRGRIEGDPAEAQVAELRSALDGAGWHLPPGATLLELERRVAAAGRRAIADYAARLRDHRYAPDGLSRPDAEHRRAMRRALITGGPFKRLRAWMLVPPGGPRPQR